MNGRVFMFVFFLKLCSCLEAAYGTRYHPRVGLDLVTLGSVLRELDNNAGGAGGAGGGGAGGEGGGGGGG